MENFVHPEKKPDEFNLGNIELNLKEKENFDLVKEQTGLKTIRIAEETYDDSGKKIRQMQGICDIFGPFTLFINKSEFRKIMQTNKKITPRGFFKKIINRKPINT